MPILDTGSSVNQTFPSGPTVMPGMDPVPYPARDARPGTTNSLIVPEAVIWPIARLKPSTHHNDPSGVAVSSSAAFIGNCDVVGIAVNWTCPNVEIVPIASSLPFIVNARLPFGSAVIPQGAFGRFGAFGITGAGKG